MRANKENTLIDLRSENNRASPGLETSEVRSRAAATDETDKDGREAVMGIELTSGRDDGRDFGTGIGEGQHESLKLVGGQENQNRDLRKTDLARGRFTLGETDILKERERLGNGLDLKNGEIEESEAGNQGNEEEEEVEDEEETLEEETGEKEAAEEAEEDEEEEPPRLKYKRLTGLPSGFFERDPVSACVFHESIFMFASHSGIIHMTDTDLRALRTFKAHRASVLSMYTDGSYFATGSMDGTVVIGSITDENDIIAYDFKRPVHAVALDKDYYRTRTFFSGGKSGKVVQSSKNWLNQRSDIVLDENNGPIVCLQRLDDLVLWMNDLGITVYHTTKKQKLMVIDRPEDSPRSDLYWPCVDFPETDRILIGWANYIWSLRVTTQRPSNNQTTLSSKSKILSSAATISFRNAYEKKVEIEYTFKVDELISGISSFKDDLIMVLTYQPHTTDPKTHKPVFHNPDIKLISSTTGEVEYEEELGLRRIDGLGLNDFSLGSHIGDYGSKYFIVSAKDAVIAQEFQLADSLEWYLQQDNYLEAWKISKHLLPKYKQLNYGVLYVDSLVQCNKWQEAANVLTKLLFYDSSQLGRSLKSKSTIEDLKSESLNTASNVSELLNEVEESYYREIVSQWETWGNIFIQAKHVPELTRVLPKTPDIGLSSDIYNGVLGYWVQRVDNDETFYNLIEEWNTDLYDIDLIESKVEEILKIQPSNRLKRCLVDLYVKSSRPLKAVPHLFDLKSPDLISFLANTHLILSYVTSIPRMIRFSCDSEELDTLPIENLEVKLKEVVAILVDCRHEVDPKSLIDVLNKDGLDMISYFYLEKLASDDKYLVEPFGDERIRLYARYNRKALLPYLAKNTSYNIDQTIKLCEANDFNEELVYLLGKIGQSKKALMLIIDKLEDPEMAISFAKQQNDKEIWLILLEYSMAKPKFIKALIECADDQSNYYYDPAIIIKRIPDNVHIQGLKKSVTKISVNNSLNVLVNQLILRIIYKKSENSSKLLKWKKTRGYEIHPDDEPYKKILQKFQTNVLLSNNKDYSSTILPEVQMLGEKRPKYSHSYKNLASKLEHLSYLIDLLLKD